MKTILAKARENTALTSVIFAGLLIAPLLLKSLVTGGVGNTTTFYFFILWIPLLAMAFGLLRGWKLAFVACALINAAFIIAMIAYPHDPPMDFRRQIVYQADYLLAAALAGIFVMAIVLDRNK